MADITMCTDKTCNRYGTCYRAQAPANEHWQAYFIATPRDGDECEMFIQMSLKNEEE